MESGAASRFVPTATGENDAVWRDFDLVGAVLNPIPETVRAAVSGKSVADPANVVFSGRRDRFRGGFSVAVGSKTERREEGKRR